MFAEIPIVFSAVIIGVWGTDCLVAGILPTVQLKKIFAQITEGYYIHLPFLHC